MLYQENKEQSTQASEKSKVCFSGYTQ